MAGSAWPGALPAPGALAALVPLAGRDAPATERGGARSGNASAITALAPTCAAVRQATRAPLLRPPWTSGAPGASDHVRLGDAGHHPAQLQPGITGRQQVGRRDGAARAMREHEQEPRRRAVPVKLSLRDPGLG